MMHFLSSNAQKLHASKFFFFFFFLWRCKKFLKLIKKIDMQTKNQQTTSKGCRILIVMHQSTLQCLYQNQTQNLQGDLTMQNDMHKGTYKPNAQGEKNIAKSGKIYVGTFCLDQHFTR
jgi:hypothetical protein